LKTSCEESGSQASVKRQVSAIMRGGFREVIKASLHASRSMKFGRVKRRKRFDAGSRRDFGFGEAIRSSDFSPVQNAKGLESRTSTSEIRSAELMAKEAGAMTAIGTQPNQALEPTTLLVTRRAFARHAPSKVVAHL
jgi:hypothetical protein